MTNYKVIFHIDEMHKWDLVLANTKNLIHALSDHPLTIIILANAEAVKYLIQASNTDEMKILELINQRVEISACNNSIRAFEIDPHSLFSFVSIVPSGVAELAIKQNEGFVYIKP